VATGAGTAPSQMEQSTEAGGRARNSAAAGASSARARRWPVASAGEVSGSRSRGSGGCARRPAELRPRGRQGREGGGQHQRDVPLGDEAGVVDEVVPGVERGQLPQQEGCLLELPRVVDQPVVL
jgi:hypothetical protein